MVIFIMCTLDSTNINGFYWDRREKVFQRSSSGYSFQKSFYRIFEIDEKKSVLLGAKKWPYPFSSVHNNLSFELVNIYISQAQIRVLPLRELAIQVHGRTN